MHKYISADIKEIKNRYTVFFLFVLKEDSNIILKLL